MTDGFKFSLAETVEVGEEGCQQGVGIDLGRQRGRGSGTVIDVGRIVMVAFHVG